MRQQVIETVGVGVEETLAVFREIWQPVVLEKLRHEAGVRPSCELQMSRSFGNAEDEFRGPLEGLDPGPTGSDESTIDVEQDDFDHSFSVC